MKLLPLALIGISLFGLFGIFSFDDAFAQINEGTFEFPNGSIVGYYFENGDISEMLIDEDAKSIIVKVASYGEGAFAISIPRELLDSKVGSQDAEFFVLIDGEQIEFVEERNQDVRTITVGTLSTDREFEIIGTTVYSGSSNFAQTELSVYIDDLPQGESRNVDEMLKLSSDYWTAYDGTSFQRVYDENQADIRIYWVKNFGHETLGHEIVQNINLGLGDELCDGWQPFSDNFVTTTMAHELGHAIGYDHVDDPNDLMYYQSNFYEYAIESHTRTSIPGYSYFIPVCTLNESTQYQYEISVDDNNFSFSTYFVPSAQEFDKHVEGKDIQIYQGCIEENSNYVRDSCNVGAGSGLIVSVVDGPQNQLAEISINLQEIPGNVVTQTTLNSEIIPEEPKSTPVKAPPSFSPNIPENTLISNDWVTLEQKIFSLSENISPTIVLEGSVKEFGTSSSQKLILFIVKPDGSYEQLHILVNNLGEFSTTWLLKSDSPSGQYHISGKYNQVDLPPIFFAVSDAGTSVASEVFSSNIATEEMSVWEMNEFFINYPNSWSVETDYEITNGETGMLSIVDDVNYWNAQINVNYVKDVLTGENINDVQYREELIQFYSDGCTSGQESFDVYGYSCSDFSLIDSKTFSLNGIKAHQISYSWKESYSDGTYYDNTTIITEIPRGQDIWEIYSETSSSSYSMYLPIIDDVISSFVLKSVSAQPVNSPILSSTQQTEIFVNTDKGTYVEGDQIIISGHVDAVSSLPTVSIQVTAPNGNLVRIDQPTIDSSGNFQTSFKTGGTMKALGTYSIVMTYGTDSISTVFEFDEISQPVTTPTVPTVPVSPPVIEEEPEISQGITAFDIGRILGSLVLYVIPIIVIIVIILKIRKRRRSKHTKNKQEIVEEKVESKPTPTNHPIISRTWEISSRDDPTSTNTVTVGINYTNSFVDSTWKTGGLHEIKDGHAYGEYCLTLSQSSVQTQIIGIFEHSLPLYGWKHSETEGLQVYEMRTVSATLDESKMFFSKTCENFETELKKKGYTVRLL